MLSHSFKLGWKPIASISIFHQSDSVGNTFFVWTDVGDVLNVALKTHDIEIDLVTVKKVMDANPDTLSN